MVFHAFFRQYYNLRNLLKKIDAYKYLIPIDDYLILTKKILAISVSRIIEHGSGFEHPTSMAKTGIYTVQRCDAEPRVQER